MARFIPNKRAGRSARTSVYVVKLLTYESAGRVAKGLPRRVAKTVRACIGNIITQKFWFSIDGYASAPMTRRRAGLGRSVPQ